MSKFYDSDVLQDIFWGSNCDPARYLSNGVANGLSFGKFDSRTHEVEADFWSPCVGSNLLDELPRGSE